MTETGKNIFERYTDAAERLVNGLTKARAIKLSDLQSSVSISSKDIGALYRSLDCNGWNESKGKNWHWREKMPEHTAGHSPEVSLERAVAVIDLKKWTCQMSTSSGVEGQYLHRRRAIDLVRRIKSRHYAFIELKVESDNPLYALFEVLGYALAYLHARSNSWEGKGEHNVFDAEFIELTILGPEHWYKYDKRGAGAEIKYELGWLQKEIEDSLNEFVKSQSFGGLTFSIKFREFGGKTQDQRVEDICRRSRLEWWTREPPVQ